MIRQPPIPPFRHGQYHPHWRGVVFRKTAILILSMTYWRLYYHLIWGTKNRVPMIDPVFEADLYRVLTAKAGTLSAVVPAIGGTADHVHIAVTIPPAISVSSFAGQLKGNLTHFVNHSLHPDFAFDWQNEFGVISFSEEQLETIIQYITRQKEHHALKHTIHAFETDLG
jgi:putative transposase